MKSALIFNRDGYTVRSWGNGTAYEVRGPKGETVFFQGGDIFEWESEREAWEKANPNAAHTDFLAQTLADYVG